MRNIETEKTKDTGKKMQILTITVLTLFAAVFTLTGYLIYDILDSDLIYEGVYINNVYVGRFTRYEAEKLLHRLFSDNLKNNGITITADGKEVTFTLEDIGYTYDVDASIEKAYTVGRTGNAMERLFEIFRTKRNEINIPLEHSYDEDLISKYVSEIYDMTFIDVQEHDVVINDNILQVRTGHHGRNIDKEQTIDEVKKLIDEKMSGSLEVPVRTTFPADIDVERLYEDIVIEPVNASFSLAGKELVINPHTDGRTVDKTNLTNFISNLKDKEDKTFFLTLEKIPAQLTEENARTMVFRDVLATAYSKFYDYDENERNRAENIKLASEKINGLIMLPGDVFSFNTIVGPRTPENGFKTAHVYVAGEVIDDYGGGICQVSSTLYNAVLTADLEVTERLNHMFTVGYVPLGCDATVSYGSVDFKFRNNSNWPIKLVCRTNERNELFFDIIGTNETPWKKIVIDSETVKTMDFKEVTVEDPNLPKGVTKVMQEGKKGYVVDTYKIVKNGEEILSRTKLYTSVYNPLNKKVAVGTKEVENKRDNPETTVDANSLAVTEQTGQTVQ